MSELKKTLTSVRGAALMLNIVLGSGLLVLPGLAVQQVGTQSIYFWIVCGLVAVPLLAVFALLGRVAPDAGGIASIAGKAFGRPFYVISTFLFLGTVVLGLPAIALTGGYYASSLFGGAPEIYAVGLIVLAALANFRSADAAGRFGSILTALMLFALFAVLAAGFWAVEPVLDPPDLSVITTLGASKAIGVSMMLFFAFTGWEVAANLSEEFRNPYRDIPVAIGLSFIGAMVLYASLALLAQSANLTSGFEAPFAQIFAAHYGVAGSAAVSLVAIVLIAANLIAAVWAVSRMVYSAAREKLLPQTFQSINRGIPDRAIILTAAALICVVVLSGLDVFSLAGLLERAGKNFLILYGFAAAALFQLDSRFWHRVLGVVSCLTVLAILALQGGASIMYPLALGLGGLAVSCLVGRRDYRISIIGQPGE